MPHSCCHRFPDQRHSLYRAVPPGGRRSRHSKAKVEQSEQERRQAEVVAQRQKIQAEGEANAVREQAHGKADGELLLATARSKARSW